MPSRDQDEIVARYIERLSALEADPEEPALDAERLADIAREVGIGEEQLARASLEVERQLGRARELAGQGRFDEAEVAVRVAEDLAPYSPEPARARFVVALARWCAERGSAAADACEEAAVAALRACRGDPTLEMEVAAFREGRARAGAAPPASTGAWRWLVAWAALGLLLLAGLGTWLLWSEPAPQLPDSVGVWVPPVVTKPAVEAPAEAHVTGPRELPLELVTTPPVEALAVVTQGSVLNVYRDSAFYRLRLEWENRTPVEIHQLSVRVELLDPAGEVAHVEHAAPIAEHDVALRPGGRRPFRALVRASDRPVSARLVVKLALTLPAAERYPPGPPLPLRWAVPQPPGMDVALRQRALAHRAHGFSGDKHFHELVFELTNTGTLPIQVLKLEVRYDDTSGRPLGSDGTWLATSDGPALRPGVTWVGRTVEILPRAVGGFSLAVIDAR